MNQEEFQRFLRSQGYVSLVKLNGKLCGLQSFIYTTGLIVGIDGITYERRYCYERLSEAAKALASWNGLNHPSGPWIKCKGVGIDLLNPEFELND